MCPPPTTVCGAVPAMPEACDAVPAAPEACDAVPAMPMSSAMCPPPAACDAAPAAPEPAPKPLTEPPKLTCSVCSASFPSKTKLFKHLRDGCVAGLTAQIKSANAIVQVGYRGATSADAVDAQLRAAVGEGCRVVARSGAPPRAKAPLAVAAGAAAWGDVCACVLGGSSMDPGDWCAAANARIAAAFPGAACVVEVLGRAPLESRDDFQAQDFSSVRAEVLVPAALFGAFDADSDAGKAVLKRLRDVATALLVAKRADGSAARRSWHAFADDDAAYERACCPDEGLSLCRLRKVNVASRGPFLVFAFQGDRFLRGMARRAAALAVAVALGWVDDVAAGAGVTHRVHQVHRRALWAEPEISSLVAHLICKHGRLARMEQMEAKRPVRGGTRARSAHPRPLLGAPQEARASAG